MSVSQLQTLEQVIGTNQPRSLEDALHRIFPASQEETLVQRARRIMGDSVRSLSDEELGNYLVEFQTLLSAWLDSYETSVFQGKTLHQILREE